LDGGESRVVPPVDIAIVNEPLELSLGHYSEGEAKTTEIFDEYATVGEAGNVL
jgi:hypothetical protein